MRFIKLLKVDIKQSFSPMLLRYLFFSVFMTVAFLGCRSFLQSFEIDNPGIQTILLYIYGGTKEYIPTFGEPFKLPYIWLINHLLILYVTLHYMKDDLIGFGMQVLYRSQSRMLWWLSKCLWQFIVVTIFYLIAWIILALLYGIFYSENFMSVIADAITDYIEFGESLKLEPDLHLFAEVTLLPWLFTLSMALMQMCLSLFIKPVFSYLISVVMCIDSSFQLKCFWIGNYSMAVRNEKVITNGLQTKTGIVIYFTLIVFTVFVGLIRFRKYNIIDKE